MRVKREKKIVEKGHEIEIISGKNWFAICLFVCMQNFVNQQNQTKRTQKKREFEIIRNNNESDKLKNKEGKTNKPTNRNDDGMAGDGYGREKEEV